MLRVRCELRGRDRRQGPTGEKRDRVLLLYELGVDAVRRSTVVVLAALSGTPVQRWRSPCPHQNSLAVIEKS